MTSEPRPAQRKLLPLFVPRSAVMHIPKRQLALPIVDGATMELVHVNTRIDWHDHQVRRRF